jgi:hypothetical protein
MPFARNVSPLTMPLVYGGVSISLLPGETKRLKQFRHPSTGDVYDVEHMAATFKVRYQNSGVLILDDEEIDRMTEEELAALDEDAREQMLDMFQTKLDEFNDLNLLQAHDGRPTLRRPKSVRDIAKILQAARKVSPEGLFVDEGRLEEIRKGVSERQASVIEQAKILLEGGNIEAAMAMLNMKKDAAVASVDELAPGQVLEPAPSPAGRRRAESARQSRGAA